MIHTRQLRFWTVIFVSALSAYPTLSAIPLVSLGAREPLVDADTVIARVGSFVDSPSVGFLARQKILELAETDNATQRAEDLASFLSVAPLSGVGWLQLGMARYASGAGPEKIAGALALSNLTAPNEADIMEERASFGLPLWAVLPPESRRALINDLVVVWGSLDQSRRAGFKAALSMAPERSREQIRSALLLWGKAGARVEESLNLGPTPAAIDTRSRN
jgi:hypothetical protein